MAEPPATPSARPAKPARRQIVTRVESVQRLTPGMLRIVVAGDDLAGFAVGPFSDHYVKLVLPPAGAPTRRRSTPSRSRPSCRASSGRECARTPSARGIPTPTG